MKTIRERRQRGITIEPEFPQLADWVDGHLVEVHGDYFIALDDESGFFMHKVKPETICDYIGRRDRNDIRIYENDVIYYSSLNDTCAKGECFYEEYLLIFYDEECHCFLGKDAWSGRLVDLDHAKSYTVVGNIIDDPDLVDNLKPHPIATLKDVT